MFNLHRKTLLALATAAALAALVGSVIIFASENPPDAVKPTALGLAGFACGTTDESCAKRYLVRLTKNAGPEVAVPRVAALQRRGVVDSAVDDHQLAHVIGRTAAEYIGDAATFSPARCPTSFNYGCVHGFFEHVLGRASAPTDAASSICERAADALLDQFSCYHGVGHGVLMAAAYDLGSALNTCDALSSDGQEGCWQGVFMENVIAGMRGEARQGLFARATPLAPCMRVAERHRHECFINHAGWLMSIYANDIEKSTRRCLSAPRRHVSACAASVGGLVTNPSWQAAVAPDLRGRPQADVAWQLCLRFVNALLAYRD